LVSRELWPRHWAAKILEGKTKEERQKLLDEVPEHLQNWVKKIVVNEFERRSAGSGK